MNDNLTVHKRKGRVNIIFEEENDGSNCAHDEFDVVLGQAVESVQ